MILKQLTPNTYYLPFDSSRDRPTLGYIKGSKYSVMIDCGTSKNHLDIFYKGLEERNLPKPQYSIITHWHWDHTFAMNDFKGFTIANSATNNRLQQIQKWKWTDQDMKDRLDSKEEIEFCDQYIRKEYPVLQDIQITTADIIFENQLILDLGDIHCHIQKVGWQHAEDSNIIFIPEEQVFFVGDADSEDFYNNNGKYKKDELEKTIKFWEQKDFLWHVHGHLSPMSKKELLEYLYKELKSLS